MNSSAVSCLSVTLQTVLTKSTNKSCSLRSDSRSLSLTRKPKSWYNSFFLTIQNKDIQGHFWTWNQIRSLRNWIGISLLSWKQVNSSNHIYHAILSKSTKATIRIWLMFLKIWIAGMCIFLKELTNGKISGNTSENDVKNKMEEKLLMIYAFSNHLVFYWWDNFYCWKRIYKV